MVIATHIICTAYGFWLPNDPRGSWSEFVASWDLVLAGGKATKTQERCSVAHVAHDREARARAKQALRQHAVRFDDHQRAAIGRGFACAVGRAGYGVLACAIMPDHVHLVVERHGRLAERIAGHLKSRAAMRLREEGLHPFGEELMDADGRLPSMWAERCWKVFLDSEEDVGRAVRYVEDNPVKIGWGRQHWTFVIGMG